MTFAEVRALRGQLRKLKEESQRTTELQEAKIKELSDEVVFWQGQVAVLEQRLTKVEYPLKPKPLI